MNTKNLVPQEFSGNDFNEIIGAPLIAASKANAAMAAEQVEFLLRYGFESDGRNYTPRMITMSITRLFMEPGGPDSANPKMENATATFEIPLITLLPLSSLAVEKVTLDFDFEVTSEVSTHKDSTQNANSYKNEKSQVKLKGRVGASGTTGKNISKYSNQSRSLFKVKAISGTLPLPHGVKMMLDLYTKSISPKEIK